MRLFAVLLSATLSFAVFAQPAGPSDKGQAKKQENAVKKEEAKEEKKEEVKDAKADKAAAKKASKAKADR